MTIEWPKIREKELYFIREIARLQRKQKENMISKNISKGKERIIENSNKIVILPLLKIIVSNRLQVKQTLYQAQIALILLVKKSNGI